MRNASALIIAILSVTLPTCNHPFSPNDTPDPSLVLDLHINNSVSNASQYTYSINFVNPSYGPDRHGNANHALHSNRENPSYVLISPDTNLDFNSKSFMISLWIKSDSNQINGAGIITKGLAAQEQFSIDVNFNKLRFWVRSSPTHLSIILDSTPLDTKWHCISAKYDRATDSIHFHRDSILIGAGIAPKSLLKTQEPISIGARKDISGAYGYVFSGSISEIKIYNRIIR